MLDREGLQTVGALQDVKTELSKLRGVLFYKILEDLHAHLYHKGEHSPALFNINEREDKIPTTTAIALSRKTNSSLNGHGEDGVLEHHKTASDSNGGDGALKDAKDAHQVPTWLSDATPDEFIEAMTKSDAPLHVKYLQTMVECLCMLGKVAACGAIIWCVVSLLLDYLYLLLKIPLCMENWRYMLQCYIMDCRLAASD
nr:Exocyst complex component SEC8 [Ipomoea batatas]GMC50106.1 Exocyst complex component SEC8 [Ipomoea batatas]GMC54695.1 Exocyst complex component SEC8 [Ipomoea batatas]GMC55845.1 Exocyst complex component SEC8 [Ipomoea batatas]